jgi:hypothetical protein
MWVALLSQVAVIAPLLLAAAAPAAADTNSAPIHAQFMSPTLSGGAGNELAVPVQIGNISGLPTGTLTWEPKWDWPRRGCVAVAAPPAADTAITLSALAMEQDKDDNSKTLVNLGIPAPPCWWPPVQHAKITISGDVAKAGSPATAGELFVGIVPVSAFWLPGLLTLAVIALIYIGAAVPGYVERCRNARRIGGPNAPRPSFWISLDPVQITRNAWGRGSISRLQSFGFTLIVFGILLFYQLRNGLLIGLSNDVLILLGISGVGAAAGGFTYTAMRRLSLDNWAWLQRTGWLKPRQEIQPRARWRDLVIDPDLEEFDVYSFQMVVFSFVVAVALVSTKVTGFATFQIPGQLLALLGLSQTVYVGGKAVGTNPYAELDAKLTELRDHEHKYLAATKDDEKKQELEAFNAAKKQAAYMFWATYQGQAGNPPDADAIEPGKP